jgi:hypothetical protein
MYFHQKEKSEGIKGAVNQSITFQCYQLERRDNLGHSEVVMTGGINGKQFNKL